jgi:hypothetical protein
LHIIPDAPIALIVQPERARKQLDEELREPVACRTGETASSGRPLHLERFPVLKGLNSAAERTPDIWRLSLAL